MERRWSRCVIGLVLAVFAGCNSGSSTAPSASLPSDPAAQVAHQFLEAVVEGDTTRASQLLTPLAVERINASGKPFQLPGLANYTFRVGQVRYPAEDKAFVQCMGTDRSTDGKTIEEEFCWLLSRAGDQWRIAGISYSAGPQKTLMIYSFEEPERGAVPVQQLMARAGQTAAAGNQVPTQSTVPAQSSPTPRTAHEVVPAATYR